LALAAPDEVDVVRLLRAWRTWLLAGVLGGLLGSLAYVVAPPPFRVRATVNVDFHLEQAWPQNSDREQFYYLERETRKLMEIAFADNTMQAVSEAVPGITVQQLRSGAAQLSQPGNGGWHFYGTDRDPKRAALIATTWAGAFAGVVQEQVAAGSQGLEPFITADVTQAEALHPERTIGLGTYVLTFGVAVLGLVGLAVLFAGSGIK
jgi:hypothetical protein